MPTLRIVHPQHVSERHECDWQARVGCQVTSHTEACDEIRSQTLQMSHLNWAQLRADMQVCARHGAMQPGTGYVRSSATATLMSKDTSATYLEHELLVSKGVMQGRVRRCSELTGSQLDLTGHMVDAALMVLRVLQ